MHTKLQLLKPRNCVPELTEFTGKVITGFKIITASDLKIAKNCIDFARIRGFVGGEDYVYEISAPEAMIEDRKIVRWAIVERL